LKRQATYLAAEGIEIVKNLIDHDVYEQLGGNPGYSWGSCFPYSGSHYYYPIDYTTTNCASLDFSNGPPNTPLYFDPTTHMYSESVFGGNETDFVRSIKVINNGQSIDVQSTVTWSVGPLGNTITLEDVFYHYQ
jgi:hypothetical protein